MKRPYILEIFFSLVVGFYCHAVPIGQPFEISRFNVKNGLSSNRVNDIAQDSNGFIWLATSNGLEKFDGYEFCSMRSVKPSNDLLREEVCRIDIKDDNLLLIYDDAAEIFNQRTGKIVRILDSLLMGANLRDGKFVDDDIVLLGGTRGLYHYSIPTATLIQIESFDDTHTNILKNIRSIRIDNKSTIWIATARNGVFYASGDSVVFNRIQGILPDDIFATSFASYNGELYIGTWDDGIYTLRSDGNKLSAGRIDTAPLGWTLTYSLSFDALGNLWVGTPSGVHIVSVNDDNIRCLVCEQEAGLHRAREVKRTFVDLSGNIWYTDQGNGVARASYPSNAVSEINFLDLGLPYSEVTAIYRDEKGYIWAGINGAGLVRYNLPSGELLPPSKILDQIRPEANGIVSILELPQINSLLLCTRYDGVYCVKIRDGEPIKLTHVNISDGERRYNFTTNAVRASSNDAWVATTQGLVLFHSIGDSLTFSIPKELNDIIDNDKVEAILKDSYGDLWVATHDNGLFRITYDYLIGVVTEWKHYLFDDSILRAGKVQCLFEDSKRNIWVGDSSVGLLLYNKSDDAFYVADNSSQLPSGCICAITEDDKGILWISTDCGFVCYDPMSDTKIVANGKIAGSMSNVSFLPRSVYQEDGLVMFGGYRGISICNPDRVLRNESVRKPMITEVSYPGLDRRDFDDLPPYTAEIKLKHTQRDIGLKFACVGVDDGGIIRYAYKLDKVDKEWRFAGSQGRSVNYVNLKPGRYVFRVKASPTPENWTDEQVVKLRVLPSPWGYCLAAMLIVSVALVISLYSYKKKKEKVENDLKTFREEISLQSIPLSGTDLDKQFISKIVKVIEENLSNPKLDIDFLCKAMNMSISTLYRKIKSITGLATKEFLRQTRYKYACKFLLEKSSNISDVAYRVGFSNAKYFSQCFKKEFGKTPSQFIIDNQKNNTNETTLC